MAQPRRDTPRLYLPSIRPRVSLPLRGQSTRDTHACPQGLGFQWLQSQNHQGPVPSVPFGADDT